MNPSNATIKAANMPTIKKVQRSVLERVNSGSCIRLFRRKITEAFYVSACFGEYFARHRRYAVGVWPVALRNAAVNELVSRKPTANPISVTDDADSTNNVLARSMRRLPWYRCGGVPNDCRKTRQKWYGLRQTSRARVVSDICSARCSSM